MPLFLIQKGEYTVHVEIMFDDLVESKQRELLAAYAIKAPEEMN